MPPYLLLLLLHLLLLLSALSTSSAARPPSAASFLVSAARLDALRHRRRTAEAISLRRRKTCELPRNATHLSFTTHLISGAYTGTGQYFATFLVGTPAQRFLLILDTGSDLTWVKCRRSNGTAPAGGAIFAPEKSKTFRPIPCSASLCKSSLPFSLTACPDHSSPCLYDYRYSDGSKAKGLYGHDSATVKLPSGRRVKLRDIVLGCTSSYEGVSFTSAGGVLGLSQNPTSFAAAAGGRFAYCLVDHLSPKNATGFLSFGHREPPVRLKHAALVLDQQMQPFYAVQITGLFIDGEKLNISRDVWNASAGGGAILDTGTTLTLLAEPAYRAVVAVLSRALSVYPRVEAKPFEFCYNWTAAPAAAAAAALPRLAVHMKAYGRGGSVRLRPPQKSYVVDVAEGVKCIGLLPAAWPGVSTIGNILQQNHYWYFDVLKGSFGFGPYSCS